MKKLLALSLCFLSLGCIVGVNLKTPEETVKTWVRSYNDRDVKGIYVTLSKSYVFANGGEERVKADIKSMLEDAKELNITYKTKSIGRLALPKEEDEPILVDIYLVKMDKEYTENGEKKTEELILNFKIEKEDGKYKIAEYWD